MDGEAELIQQAAGGSLAAHLGLVDLAIAAGASGEVRQIESLIAAETWARLAASAGGVAEHRALVGVLLARAEFEDDRFNQSMVTWYRGEARRILKLLIAMDDPDAAQALVEIGPAIDVQHHDPDVSLMADLSKAAKGDLLILAALFDEAYNRLGTDGCDPLEALTVCELYARLGASVGDGGHMRRLAGTMLKRAEWEYADGSSIIADAAISDAAVVLSILIECGDTTMVPWLSLMVEGQRRLAVAAAICARPSILRFVEPEGNC